jgi:S-adenosylmethionine hydrolase
MLPIFLLTDFGIDDPYVGIMKGRILADCPAATIVDLSHGVPPQRADIAGLWLASAWRHLPAAALCAAVVDPGVGTARRILLGRIGRRWILAPDNGLADELFTDSPPDALCAVDIDRLVETGLPSPGATFHGRDVFAPVAAGLAGGSLGPKEIGSRVDGWAPSSLPRPRPASGGLLCPIVHVDHYGNLITSARLTVDMAGEGLHVRTADRRVALVRTYAEVAVGEPLALVNSFGLLELAVRDGSATRALRIGPGDELLLEVPPGGLGCYSGEEKQDTGTE